MTRARLLVLSVLVALLAGCGGGSGLDAGTVKKQVEFYANGSGQGQPGPKVTIDACNKTADVFAGDPIWRCQGLVQGSEHVGYWAVGKPDAGGSNLVAVCRDNSGNWTSVDPNRCAADFNDVIP